MGRKSSSRKDSKAKKVSEIKDDEKEEVWDMVRVIPTKEKCACRTEGCKGIAVATWASNLEPDDEWDTCEDCQLKDFGGWPEGVDHPDDENEEIQDQEEETKTHNTNQSEPEDNTSVANSNSSEETKKVVCNASPCKRDANQSEITSLNKGEAVVEAQKNQNTPVEDKISQAPPKESNEVSQNSTASETRNDEVHQDEEDAEIWTLKKILSYNDITKEGTIKCSTEDCTLPACSVWISNLAPTKKWYSCIDCQENDFEGWPPLEELPLEHMEPKHLQVLTSKCSKQKNPTMPSFPSLPTSPSQKQSKTHANFVTPPPNSLVGKVPQASDAVAGKAAKITPNTSSSANPKPNKPSAGALAMHKKWQEEAEARGGKDARIVVKKPEAKKIIFDFLFDEFCPMNITQVYEGLKATVPKPILNACLQDMALDKHDDKSLFVDSDDEEETIKQDNTSEPYAGSLRFKPGRNIASNLYYVDHTKLKGMDRDQQDALAQNIATATSEEGVLKESLKTTLSRVSQLLTEPTNEEAAVRLQSEMESMKDLEAKLESARKLKVNEKHKQKTKRRIQNMAAQWRKRKRLCMDFLISLEENTDGAVTAKKCLAGDGQIALDSDETVARAAIQMAKDTRSRSMKGRKKTFGKKQSSNPYDGLADKSFVAVRLDSQNNVSRVYVD